MIGPLAGRTVLVLVQHPPQLEAVATAIERAGARAVTARTYQEALPLVVLEKVDAMVCEVSDSSTRDGVELLRTMRGLGPVGDHLRSARSLALGEISQARNTEPGSVAFDDRMERTSSPGAVVNRLARLLH